MINLLRAEQYKITNNKPLKIVLFALVLFSMVFGILLLANGLEDLNLYYGMKAQAQYSPYLVASNSFIITISIGIFVGVFVGDEIDKGIVRNIISSGNGRVQYYLTKLLSQLLMCILFTLVLTISFVLIFTISIGWGEVQGFRYAVDIVKLIGLQTLIYFAYASFFVMIAFINRNVGATIGSCIVIVLIENIFAQMFSQIKIPLLSTVIKYLPQTLLGQLGNSFPYNEPLSSNAYVAIACVSIIIICSTTLIGIVNFKTRDI